MRQAGFAVKKYLTHRFCIHSEQNTEIFVIDIIYQRLIVNDIFPLNEQ